MKNLCTYTTTIVVFLFAANTVFADGVKPIMTKHVVSQGEYVMGIAESIHGSSDVCKTDDFIKYVVAYNYLDANATIHPGQTLFIPTYDSWQKYIYTKSVRGKELKTNNKLESILKENEKLKGENGLLLSEIKKNDKNTKQYPANNNETIVFVKDNSEYILFIGIGFLLFVFCVICLFMIRKNKKTIHSLRSVIREKEEETIEITKNTGNIAIENKKLQDITRRVAHITDVLFQEKGVAIHDIERITRWFDPVLDMLKKINTNKTPTGECLANIISYILERQPDRNKKDIIWSLVGRLVETEENENIVVKAGWTSGHDRMLPILVGIMNLDFNDLLFQKTPETNLQET